MLINKKYKASVLFIKESCGCIEMFNCFDVFLAQCMD